MRAKQHLHPKYINLSFVILTSEQTVQFDPYSILEIDVGASPEEIKKSYRKLSLQYHPDKNPSEDASEKYIKIAKAYETLTGTSYFIYSYSHLNRRSHS
jgi:DnaJ-class molecular chaperone